MIVCTVGLSISILVYIIVFQYFFAYRLGWFPVQGWGSGVAENLFRYAALPILIGLTVSIAPNLRLYRTFFLDEINQDYVRTARAKGPVRAPHHVGARAAQCVDPDHHPPDGGAARPAAGLVPDRALLLDSRHRPRGDPRRRALGLPGDQGDHRVRRLRHHPHQPARRFDVQGGRPAGPAQVSATAITRPLPHAVSPGLWALAWRRLRADAVGMVALAIVVAFCALVLLSGAGLVAADWATEAGVNYAPPTFAGADPAVPAVAPSVAPVNPDLPAAPEAAATPDTVDPLAEVMAEIRGARTAAAAASPGGGGAAGLDVVDPLAEVLADIRRDAAAAGASAAAAGERASTLPFGGDKWGRDVLKKVIKGSETSIFVGIAAALVATALGTLFGALAGYYGGWIDDGFNWFYSVFSSIPYLLLILAVAAVLQQKGTLTIVLILGLTGWTGIFRLVRGEYLKHKAREYVQAADAIGASHARRMFRHIFPNVSHVVLVQLSILVVAFIKSEVILSFLGFGVPVDVVSWGSMLNEAQNELILGKWWQLAAAGTAMAILVTAFSLFTDALRDALDPKLKGSAGA
ncbi:MAG: ABC transporter permease subunit [Betaproteobacteria bacterium]|nr:ABC transporter permease subunit [Betaproteobacteria bacterium]